MQVGLLAIMVVFAYGHTLDVPFYLDDFSSIQENPVIYNWQGTWAELWQFAALRIVGYFSFAFNYQIHQFQVAGYHVINIIIHFLAGGAVLALLRGLVRTPAINSLVTSEEAKLFLPIVVALIFVLHPLQIQGVTYIVQRLASLAAFFYIATMACFIQARLATKNLPRSLWIFACLLLTLLAFFTKQNTVTLPIALLLLEFIFFPGRKTRLLITGGIALFGLGIAWLILAWVFKQNPFSLQAMQALTRETTAISRTSYLATQMNVLWTYISLFFWPFSSHIDYSYPINEGFLYVNNNYHLVARLLHSEAILALVGHLLILGIAGYNLRRRPLIAFGIGFYYLAHAIESSLIPIRDVIFEHRTYLPNLGLAILCAWLLVIQLPRWLSKQLTQIIIISLILILSTATWFRNQMWRDPVALWQHNVEQSPDKKRAWIILGKHLIQSGQFKIRQNQVEEGRKALKKGIETLNGAIVRTVNVDGTISQSVTTETALNLVVAHKSLGQYNKALTWVNSAITQKLRPFDLAKFLVNRGNIYYELGRKHRSEHDNKKASAYYRKSEASYRQAIKVYPQNLKARINLASILGITGHLDEAIALYEEVLTIDASNAYVKKNLQKLRGLQKR